MSDQPTERVEGQFYIDIGNKIKELESQLASEREAYEVAIKDLRELLEVEREKYQSARRSSDMGWQRAEDYKQQLAAEREKVLKANEG